MRNYKITCPFCGIDITNECSSLYTIPQEETVSRDFSIGHGWLGKSYIQETKQIRHFKVFCCKHCYNEHQKYEIYSEKIILTAGPIGIVAGLSFFIYKMIVQNAKFEFVLIIGGILYGVIGLFLFASPNLFLYFAYGKRTYIKHASKCNAIYY